MTNGLQYDAFIYEEHLTPKGLLPREVKERASAAWHFTRLAMGALERIPEQVSLEGNTDLTVKLRDLAESVRIQYGLKGVEDFLSLMDFCHAEGIRSGYPWNDRLQAWLNSGGRAYDTMTREEGAFAKNG